MRAPIPPRGLEGPWGAWLPARPSPPTSAPSPLFHDSLGSCRGPLSPRLFQASPDWPPCQPTGSLPRLRRLRQPVSAPVPPAPGSSGPTHLPDSPPSHFRSQKWAQKVPAALSGPPQPPGTPWEHLPRRDVRPLSPWAGGAGPTWRRRMRCSTSSFRWQTGMGTVCRQGPAYVLSHLSGDKHTRALERQTNPISGPHDTVPAATLF